MEQIKLQLTGGNNRGDRRELDYYPTPKEVTVALIAFLDLPASRVIWEPACGDGAMTTVFKYFGYSVIETDIIHGNDYLSEPSRKCDAIITNPPFYLSEQFIRKAITEAPIVAMLLKSQYWHAAKRYDLFKAHPPSYVCPLTWRPDFLEHTRMPGDKKGAPTMEVAWSIWKRGSKHETIYHPLIKPQ